MATSSATSILSATSAPLGHLTALEHRPAPQACIRGARALPALPRALMVTREFYSPRVVDMADLGRPELRN
jgi:hypothetical protein